MMITAFINALKNIIVGRENISLCGIEDDVGYDSYNRRLNTLGVYCSYNASLNMCVVDLVSYNTTARCLAYRYSTTTLNRNCVALTSTQYNATVRCLQTISRSARCVSGV